jgi:hypothetical protein
MAKRIFFNIEPLGKEGVPLFYIQAEHLEMGYRRIIEEVECSIVVIRAIVSMASP